MPIVSVDEFTKAIFDYIIIGGGTAGLALAVRLTEDADVNVGVIEAGKYDARVPEIFIPGMRGRAVSRKELDWTFVTTPQTECNDRTIFQPRGKALGGSSMLNFMLLFRPNKEEYDALAELGNKSWTWDNLLKYTMKSEKTIPHTFESEDAIKYGVKPDPKLHGTEGPIVKSIPSIRSELHVRFLDALEALGVPRNPEPNGGRIAGAFTCYTSVDPTIASRSYVASGYYEPSASRTNLLVLTGAHVSKVLLEGAGEEPGLKKAVGIEFIKDDAKHVTQAPRRDVIISCGSLQTPQVLELSGVGSRAILEEHGIECKIDLPAVGENLQDHVYAPVTVEIDPKHDSMESLYNPEVLAEHTNLYKQGKGYLAELLGSAFGFFPLKAVASPAEIRAMQAFADVHITESLARIPDPAQRRGREKLFALQRRWFADAQQTQLEIMYYPVNLRAHMLQTIPDGSKKYLTLLAMLSHPFSRGAVHITSPDPLAPPAINPSYFNNPADLAVLARGLKFVLRVLGTPHMKDEVKDVVTPEEISLGETAEPWEVEEEKIKAHIRATVGPVFHPVGTAAMLPKEDGGVVDDKLKVYGTSNLRVVDVSVLPLELSCHIQSAAYAIAEMAADIIRERI